MSLIKSDLLSSVNGIVHGFSDKTLDGDEGSIARILGLNGINLLRQVHGDRVVVISEQSLKIERDEGDAQVTDISGVGLGVATADCVPILLASEDGSVVASVHAGWRGTLSGISAKAVQSMKESYAVDPGRLKAAVGPSIGGCCYEVGADVGSGFMDKYENIPDYLSGTENGKYRLDLRAVNEYLLRKEGVSEIEIIDICTMCSPDYYSYRGDGKGTGRQLSVIGISL